MPSKLKMKYRCYIWEDQFLQTQRESKPNLDLPVVIMAEVKNAVTSSYQCVPKPLLPIGKQTIIEDIMIIC